MYRHNGLSIALAGFAIIAAGFTAGCSAKPNDSQLVTDIQSQMFADAQLKGSSLQVTSAGGEVTLKGSVPNDAARYEAYKIATQTSGVTKVNDQMTIDASQSAQAAPVDAAQAPAPVAPAPEPAHAAPVKKSHEKHHSSSRHDTEGIAQNSASPDMSSQAPPPSSNSQPAPPDAQAAPAPPPVQSAPPPPPPPPQPVPVQVAAGTTITIRMIDGVDSSVNKAGEVFHASLDAPIVVGDNVVVPKGADVYVRLTSASSAGKMTGQSELKLALAKLEFQGQSYPLVSSTYSETGKSRGKDTATKIGGGAALGAIIGAIAGGGKGAAIGAAAGGGAGTVYQGATHGQQIKIASETKLDFQLEQPVTVNVTPRNNQ